MAEVKQFRQTVWEHYRRHSRDLPWRRPEPGGVFDPYKIMVSEIMLQQTQVGRVVPKYAAFLAAFPTVQSLASAELSEVLAVWSGLGYNRRAKHLHEAAKAIATGHNGVVPKTLNALITLPGIGRNTAGAIMAYAYNQPVVFVETNIRTVMIHHFFNDHPEKVSDADILKLVEAALPDEHYREWYWALMDYGTYLKKTHGTSLEKAKAYTRQSTFQGSRRQLRGQIIKLLIAGPRCEAELADALPDDRLLAVLAELEAERLVVRRSDLYKIA